MPANVDKYDLSWNLDTNRGFIRIHPVGASGPLELKLDSAAEFMAIATILSKPGVVQDVDNNGNKVLRTTVTRVGQ